MYSTLTRRILMKATTHIGLEDHYDKDTGGCIEVKVEWEFSPIIPAKLYGPPENCYPAEGGEMESCVVTMPDGTVVEDGERWITDTLGDLAFEKLCESAFDSAEHERETFFAKTIDETLTDC
jgi:hypothetical protein